MRLFIVLFVISSYGCSTMYIPSAPNIPLLMQEREAKINVGASTNSLYLSGAYAINSKYSLLFNSAISYGNFSKYYDVGDLFESNGEISLFDGGSFKHRNLEIGFGEYLNYKSKGVLEFFGGIGYGNAKVSSHSYKNEYGSLFFQIDNGFVKEHFELGASLKIVGSYLSYNYTYLLTNGETQNNEIEFPVISCQFGGILRFGSEKFKFYISPGLNLCKDFTDKNKDELGLGFSNNDTFYTFLHLSVGVNICLK